MGISCSTSIPLFEGISHDEVQTMLPCLEAPPYDREAVEVSGRGLEWACTCGGN